MAAGKLRILTSVAIASVLLMIALPDPAYGRPSARIVRRQKRVSDQRVAELETLIALQDLKGHLVTVPIAFGKVDPARIGRRRRSNPDDDRLEALRRRLRLDARDSDSASQESDEVLSFILKDLGDRREDEGDYQLI